MKRGEILRVDTRKLLSVKERQTATVRGKARLKIGKKSVKCEKLHCTSSIGIFSLGFP